MAGRRGFTIIELLVVTGICGLLLSFSFPTLINFRELICLDSSTYQAASDIRKVQIEAICKNESLSIGRFKFSKTGFPLPGGTGTEVLKSRSGYCRKVIVSSAGRVRVE